MELCVVDRLDWLGENGWRVEYPFDHEMSVNGYYVVPTGVGRRIDVFYTYPLGNQGPPCTDFDCVAKIEGVPVLFEVKGRHKFNVGDLLWEYGIFDGICRTLGEENTSFVVAMPENARARDGTGPERLANHGGIVLFMKSIRSGEIGMVASEYVDRL